MSYECIVNLKKKKEASASSVARSFVVSGDELFRFQDGMNIATKMIFATNRIVDQLCIQQYILLIKFHV